MPHPVYSHLTYIVHLFCLGKLSRPKYQWKLKSWKFYSKMWFWLKNLYLLKQYDAQRLLTELRDKGWKLESIDSLLKRMHETGTFVWQPGSGRPHSSCSSGGPHAQSGRQAKRHQSPREISQETAILRSSVHRIIHRDIQLKCFKRRRVQLLSEANRISRSSDSLINNLIVCIKSRYCFLINRKLNNK